MELVRGYNRSLQSNSSMEDTEMAKKSGKKSGGKSTSKSSSKSMPMKGKC